VVSAIERRKAWARHYISAAPDAPAYGTPEWLALPDGLEKVAAVVRAAECWQTDLEATLDRLRDEHRAGALTAKLAEDAEYVEERNAHRREYGRKSYKPHPAAVRREVRA
jgi:hypothetical protein